MRVEDGTVVADGPGWVSPDGGGEGLEPLGGDEEGFDPAEGGGVGFGPAGVVPDSAGSTFEDVGVTGTLARDGRGSDGAARVAAGPDGGRLAVRTDIEARVVQARPRGRRPG